MKKITCKLTFADGQVLTATAASESALESVPVEYAGAQERLPQRYERTHLGLLQAVLRQHAQDLHARFEVVSQGRFSG